MTGVAVDVVLDAKYNSGGGGDANNNGRSQIGACVCDRRTVKNEFCLKFGVMMLDVGLTMMGMSDLLLPPLLSSSANALSHLSPTPHHLSPYLQPLHKTLTAPQAHHRGTKVDPADVEVAQLHSAAAGLAGVACSSTSPALDPVAAAEPAAAHSYEQALPR